MITVQASPRVDRDVTITMKEGHADILRALVGGIRVLPSGRDTEQARLVAELYLALVAAGVGETSTKTFSDYFSGTPEIR